MEKLTPRPKGKIVDLNVNVHENGQPTIEAMQVETVNEFNDRSWIVAMLCDCLGRVGAFLKWWFS